MSTDFDFHKEEYLALRKEIETILADFSQLRLYGVGGSAAVFTWAASQKTFPSFQAACLVWAIGTLIPVFAAFGAWAKSRHVDRIGDYIKQLEAEHIPKGQLAQGWETYHDKHSRWELSLIDGAFWACLVAGATWISVSGAKNANVMTASECKGAQTHAPMVGSRVGAGSAEAGNPNTWSNPRLNKKV